MPTFFSLILILPGVGFGADPAQYVIEPPDVLRVEVSGLPKKAQPIEGERLVRPDGTVSLGAYGTVQVAGLSLDQARSAIVKQLASYAKKRQLEVRVEVLSYNSKVYYVIADEQVHRHPVQGGETVAGAILQVEGLSAKATVGPVRLTRSSGQVLKVDWRAITQEGKSVTNYKLQPGDRLYVGGPPSR
jgi:polysaccharide export outer membrane protein